MDYTIALASFTSLLFFMLLFVWKRGLDERIESTRELQYQLTQMELLKAEQGRTWVLNKELLKRVNELLQDMQSISIQKYNRGYDAGVLYAGATKEYSKDAFTQGYKAGFEAHRGHAEFMKSKGKEPNFQRRAYQHRSEDSSNEYANGGPKYNSYDSDNTHSWKHGWSDDVIDAMLLMGLTRLTKEGIKKAYKELAKQWHPDKEGGCPSKMKELNIAKDLLTARV